MKRFFLTLVLLMASVGCSYTPNGECTRSKALQSGIQVDVKVTKILTFYQDPGACRVKISNRSEVAQRVQVYVLRDAGEEMNIAAAHLPPGGMVELVQPMSDLCLANFRITDPAGTTDDIMNREFGLVTMTYQRQCNE